MLCQLSTIKTRLAIPDIDIQYDDLLTFAIEAISARFDQETNRTLARAVDTTFEFDAGDLEISVPRYPVESVSKFETKVCESAGWVEQTGIDYVVRRNCIISLSESFSIQPLAFSLPALARVTYTGGYVLPGDTASPSQTPLPADLENAAIEQVAAWFLRRDMIGLDVSWPKGGIMQRFSKLDLLLPVAQVLQTYKRYGL